MCRVYCLIGGCRYYWSKAHIWTMWSWAAELMPPAKAQEFAQSVQAEVEQL